MKNLGLLILGMSALCGRGNQETVYYHLAQAGSHMVMTIESSTVLTKLQALPHEKQKALNAELGQRGNFEIIKGPKSCRGDVDAAYVVLPTLSSDIFLSSHARRDARKDARILQKYLLGFRFQYHDFECPGETRALRKR